MCVGGDGENSHTQVSRRMAGGTKSHGKDRGVGSELTPTGPTDGLPGLLRMNRDTQMALGAATHALGGLCYFAGLSGLCFAISKHTGSLSLPA